MSTSGLTNGQSAQFAGFVNPAEHSSEARPVRGATGSPTEEDHNAVIRTALADHKKKTSLGQLQNGLQSMGVKNDEKTRSHLAGLATSNPSQFHRLVAMARKNAMGQAQNMATARRTARREVQGA